MAGGCRNRTQKLLLALALFPAFLAGADPAVFHNAKLAFDEGRYEQARSEFVALAEGGDPRAMFYLGVIHDRGLGVPQDQGKAFQWYEKAAKNGHPEAQFNLGNAFKHGRGGISSEELATYWWEMAADQGQSNAQYNLALQYHTGKGVAKDPGKAADYFNRAARGGHEGAISLIRSGRIPETPPPPEAVSPRIDRSRLISEIRKVKISRHVVVDLPILKPEWFDQQNPENITIQLAVMKNVDYLENLLREHQLLDRAIVVEKGSEDKRRYYVLLGNYPARADALKNLDRLSPAIRRLDPWIRSFGDLRDR